MKTNTENVIEMSEVKPFNAYLATGKAILGIFLLVTTLYTVKAAFVDTTLENLEENYTSAISMYGKQKSLAIETAQMVNESSDHVCDVYRALKAYKEFKKIPLKNDYNPCVGLAAPQETGSENLQ